MSEPIVVSLVTTLEQVVLFDREDDESLEDAAERAADLVVQGELRPTTVYPAIEVRGAWPVGAACDLAAIGDGPARWCKAHTSSAPPGKDRCYEVEQLEASAGVSRDR